MTMDRVLADAEALGNRLVAEAARDEPEDFNFAGRQTARVAYGGFFRRLGRGEPVAHGLG